MTKRSECLYVCDRVGKLNSKLVLERHDKFDGIQPHLAFHRAHEGDAGVAVDAVVENFETIDNGHRLILGGFGDRRARSD